MKRMPKSCGGSLATLEIEGNTFVVDTSTDRMFELNALAVRIWEHCDGTSPVETVAELLGVDAATIDVGLAELSRHGLIDAEKPVMSRRALLKVAGIAAVPLVREVLLPSAAAAASVTCTANGQDYCVAAQATIQACIDAIGPLASTACCVGTFTVITFDNPLGSNSCCGTCGPPIG